MGYLENLQNPRELYEWMRQNLTYGWLDNDGNCHYSLNAEMGRTFQIQAPTDLIKSKLGVCADQVELERSFLEERGYRCFSYLIHLHRSEKLRAHFYLIFQDQDQWIWIENAYQKQEGYHIYKSKDEAIHAFPQAFIDEFHITENDLLYVTEYSHLHPGSAEQISNICFSKESVLLKNQVTFWEEREA